jgi:manganese/zinc/iron transport system substrate-binding protein
MFAGCSLGSGVGEDGDEKASGNKLVVVTTTTHVTDMVKSVAGNRVEVVALMGPGVDPHLYKPSAKDVATLSKASLVFYSGLMLEGRMADVFAKASRTGTKAYAVTETVPEEELLEPEEFKGHWDPHIWFDPEIWVKCIEVVRDGLAEADPEGKEVYAQNAEILKTEYLAVTDWANARIAGLSEESRKLVTSHDAFNYFGRAFGIEVMAVQGISTATEAGLADRAAMVDYVKRHGVKAIFVESSVNPATIEEIARETGVKVGGELFSDAMGEPGKMEKNPDGEEYDVGTWVGMMKHNVNVFVEALK